MNLQIVEIKMNEPTIIVQIKNVYGEDRVYPICKNAQLFAKLARTKTLTRETLMTIHQLGFKVAIKPLELNLAVS